MMYNENIGKELDKLEDIKIPGLKYFYGNYEHDSMERSISTMVFIRYHSTVINVSYDENFRVEDYDVTYKIFNKKMVLSVYKNPKISEMQITVFE